jgi:hypothetical protein|tara:strand:+ start:130 stop:333 length:204 start_codon:yes stop_codon:yes gene_type:complete
MDNKKDKGVKYTLTILYNPDEDQCEYIQEEIVDDTSSKSWIIGELDLKDYFDDVDIAGLTCCEVGKS